MTLHQAKYPPGFGPLMWDELRCAVCFHSAIKLKRQQLFRVALFLTSTEVQESKSNHISTFKLSPYITSTDVPLATNLTSGEEYSAQVRRVRK